MNRRGFFGLLLGIFAGTKFNWRMYPKQKEFFTTIINGKELPLRKTSDVYFHLPHDFFFKNPACKGIITDIDIPEGF